MSGDAVLEDQAAIEVLNGPQFGLQDFGIAFHDTRLAYFAFCVKYIIIYNFRLVRRCSRERDV